MMRIEPLKAIGVSSDTGITSVEIALLTTDGLDVYETGKTISRPYSPELKEGILSVLGEKGQVNYAHLKEVERKMTDFHIEALKEFGTDEADVIGYSGHTVLHHPHFKNSCQIGDVQRIANTFHKQVVTRFIQSDLYAGGEGAPLFPTFYDAMTRKMEKPLVILDIGGLTQICYIGPNGELKAFVAGPGNLLLDAWMQRKAGQEMDFDGLAGATGKADERVVHRLLKKKYFLKEPPKAADRQDFDELMQHIEGLSVVDGAATLSRLTTELILQSFRLFLPEEPQKVIVCGGGSLNPTFIRWLRNEMGDKVVPAKDIGWSSKSLDAQGNAFLAVRHLFGLPISLPETTRVREPVSGGWVVSPSSD